MRLPTRLPTGRPGSVCPLRGWRDLRRASSTKKPEVAMADARLAVAIVLDRPRRREACGHDGLIKSSAIGAGGRYWHRSWPAQEHADPISALRQFLQEMSPNEAGGAPVNASSIQSN